MNINQQLLELHNSFRINQELNSGDRSEQILWLITRLFDEALGAQPVPSMDLILKNEMTKIVCKDEGTHDDYGFEISDEIRPTFDKFKQFLKDNDAESYWTYNQEQRDYFLTKRAESWLCCAFAWSNTKQGIDFWYDVDLKWQEQLK